MNLPIYRLDINEFDEETGIDFVSLVEAPAVERDFQAFNQDFESYTDYPEGAKEANDKAKQRKEEVRTLNQELRLLQADENDKELLALKQWYANTRKQYVENQEALLVLENIYNYKRQELRDKELKDVKKGISKQVEEVLLDSRRIAYEYLRTIV